jgi:L-threonylcarbamoyladenylate synthase
MVHNRGGEACTRTFALGDSRALPEAWSALRAGQLVAFPTDTVYGLGCDLWQPEAIVRLYRAKDRPRNLAIPVLVSAPKHVYQVAARLPPLFEEAIRRYWPGALTLIVPRRPAVPDMLCDGGPTVAVRMPDHSLALELIEGMGGTLAATSANLSGHLPAITAQRVLAELCGRVAVVLDGGKCSGGVASTIVDLVRDPPVLLRQGHLSLEALREALPALVLGAGQ